MIAGRVAVRLPLTLVVCVFAQPTPTADADTGRIARIKPVTRSACEYIPNLHPLRDAARLPGTAFITTDPARYAPQFELADFTEF